MDNAPRHNRDRHGTVSTTASGRRLFWRGVMFCSGIVAVVALAQPIMHLDSSGQTRWPEYLSEPPNTIDVLFLGSSHAHYATSPMDLWNEKGITSFNLTGSSQDLGTSYFFLNEGLKTQKPKVVALELYMARGSQMNGLALSSNYLLMPWSENKLRGYTQASGSYASFQYLLLPFMRDHNRWQYLERSDFEKLWREPEPPIGKGHPVTYITVDATERDYEPVVPAERLTASIAQLEAIARLCAENDITLVLYTVPDSLPDQKRVIAAVKDGLQGTETDIRYLDMNEHIGEIGIDWKRDFAMADGHLNHRGAVKVTRFMGEFLAEECDVTNRRGEEIANRWNLEARAYEAAVVRTEREHAE